VHFSDYDSVFDEAKGEPQIRYSPKEGEGEGDDNEEQSDALTVDESSAVPLSADDAEDLDAQPPAPIVKKEEIDDAEVVVLE
jgi:hypothetical protein